MPATSAAAAESAEKPPLQRITSCARAKWKEKQRKHHQLRRQAATVPNTIAPLRRGRMLGAGYSMRVVDVADTPPWPPCEGGRKQNLWAGSREGAENTEFLAPAFVPGSRLGPPHAPESATDFVSTPRSRVNSDFGECAKRSVVRLSHIRLTIDTNKSQGAWDPPPECRSSGFSVGNAISV